MALRRELDRTPSEAGRPWVVPSAVGTERPVVVLAVAYLVVLGGMVGFGIAGAPAGESATDKLAALSEGSLAYQLSFVFASVVNPLFVALLAVGLLHRLRPFGARATVGGS